jgi:hypothetical protein
MPAQRHPAASRGGDPVVVGIHVFLASSQLKGVDGRDKPGAVTPNKCFNTSGPRSTRRHPSGDEIYRIGLRFHTPIIAGHSAEYCRPSLSACSMSRKTLCIRVWVVTPSSIALGKRLWHRSW